MTSLRRAVLLCSLLLTILPRFAAGQTCTPGGIKNFRGTTNPTSYTIQWDVPAGAPVGAMYEVMQATAGDYCQFPSAESAYTVIATITATTYTAQKSTPESAYFVRVRLQSDHCVATDLTLVTDSFSTPPSKPMHELQPLTPPALEHVVKKCLATPQPKLLNGRKRSVAARRIRFTGCDCTV